MKNEWKRNEKNWNPVIVILLNGEWILEVNKENGHGFLRKIGNFHTGEKIMAFSTFYDCEDGFNQSWVDVAKEPFINPEGLCEGRICVKAKSGWTKSYQFLVDLKTGDRKIEKVLKGGD